MYHWFGRARGWTPQQVDELSLDELYWLPALEEASVLAAQQMQDHDR